MAKQLVIKPEKCLGCRTCEMVCSFSHYEQFNPRLAAISVIDYEAQAVSIPIMCLQCDEAPCEKVCPLGGLKREADGRIVYNADKCIKCKMCMNACPLGNIHYSPIAHHMIKCDLCGGEPKCVRYCYSGALEVIDDADKSDRRQAVADKFAAVFSEEVAS